MWITVLYTYNLDNTVCPYFNKSKKKKAAWASWLEDWAGYSWEFQTWFSLFSAFALPNSLIISFGCASVCSLWLQPPEKKREEEISTKILLFPLSLPLLFFFFFFWGFIGFLKPYLHLALNLQKHCCNRTKK